MHDALLYIDPTAVPPDHQIIEESGHGELNMSVLTGEPTGDHTTDPEVVGCGSGAVDSTGLPTELQDLLDGWGARRSTASGIDLWQLLEQAGNTLTADDGAYGAVTCPTVAE